MERQKQKLSPTERRLFEMVDFGQMEARLHAVDAIRLLVEIAKDPKVDPKTRLACANSVLDRAYGRPGPAGEWQRVDVAVWVQVDETAVRIAAAAAAADRIMDMDRFLGKVHPDQWPEWLREQMGKAGIAAYGEMVGLPTDS